MIAPSPATVLELPADIDVEELRARVAAHQRIDLMRELRPWLFYRANDKGQLHFHQAPHIVRCLFPGNGFGKTRAIGTEVAWWVHHCHPYQVTPRWPIIAVWCAETFKQFGMLRPQLEHDCFGPERSWRNPTGWKYNKSEHRYTWADGSTLWLISGDSSWTHVQGINPDAVFFDEEPPRALWNEFQVRRRGVRKTRFHFAATATQGLTWMYRELYLPWLQLHEARGQDEAAAMLAQRHPKVWAWTQGGIQDNPGADAGDVAYYRSLTFASEAERGVRMHGGFADFSGLPVFNVEAVLAMKPGLEDGESGTLDIELIRKGDHLVPTGKFAWVPGVEDGRGTVTLFERPDPEHSYVIGFDTAYGLVNGDLDYAVVLDRNTGKQVAEARGHWGDETWAKVLAGLHLMFNQAFIVGERQVGLITLRRLYDEMGVGFMYYDRDESQRSKRRSDLLGHHKRAGDVVIRYLRVAIATGERTVRSRELHRQLTKFQFKSQRVSVDVADAGDEDLGMSAPEGDHDDGVMALMYAHLGLREVARFPEPKPRYAFGTYGHAFKTPAVLEQERADKRRSNDPFAFDDEQ